MGTLLKLIKHLFLFSLFGVCEFVLQAEDFCPTCGKPYTTGSFHLECFKAKSLLYFQIAAEAKKGRLSQEDRNMLKNMYIAAALFQGIVVSIKDVSMGSLVFSPTNHPKIMEWRTLLARYMRSDWNCFEFANLLKFNLKLEVTRIKKTTQQEHDTALVSLHSMIDAQAQNPNNLKYILRDLCFPAIMLWGIYLEEIGNLMESLKEDEVEEDFKAEVWYVVINIRNERELIPFIKKVGQLLGINIMAQEEPFLSPTPLLEETVVGEKTV